MFEKFAAALQTSTYLAEKISAFPSAPDSLREKKALADFATFGLFKTAFADPDALRKALGWGLGLTVPAAVGATALIERAKRDSKDVLRDARNQAILAALGAGAGIAAPAIGVVHESRRQGEKLLRDARNQAILTAAGIGGVHGLSKALKGMPQMFSGRQSMDVPPYEYQFTLPSNKFGSYSPREKLAAAILVDDVLEQACELDDDQVKHAALVELIKHRIENTELIRKLTR